MERRTNGGTRNIVAFTTTNPPRDGSPNPWQPLIDALPDFDGQAVCASVDPDLWTAERDEPAAALRSEAIAVCQSCPIRAECLRYALDERIFSGIWGGTTGRERKIMLGWVNRHAGKSTSDASARLPEIIAYLAGDDPEHERAARGRFERCGAELGLTTEAVARVYKGHLRTLPRAAKLTGWEIPA